MSSGERTGTQVGDDLRSSGARLGVRSKLLILVLVPLLFAAALGGLLLSSGLSKANSASRARQAIAAQSKIQALISAAQKERLAAAQFAAQKGADKTTYTQRQAATDTARMALTGGHVTSALDPLSRSRLQAALAAADRLPAFRTRIGSGSGSPADAVTAYVPTINALLAADLAVASGLDDPDLARTAGALHNLRVVGEEYSFQQALIIGALMHGDPGSALANRVHTSDERLSTQLGIFMTAATPDQVKQYNNAVSSDAVDNRNRLQHRVLAPAGTVPPVVPGDWTSASNTVIGMVGSVSGSLANQLADSAGQLRRDARNDVVLAAALLAGALLVALVVLVLVIRSVRGPLRRLHGEVRQAADHDLPAATAAMRSGALLPQPPVRQRDHDEIGTLAGAFDDLHRRALHLATDQARLRTVYNEVLVDLSLRSETLVQQQLGLLETMERDEEDPDRLSALFGLDHLAIRLRRNNENLMVLSGSDLTRRFNQPMQLGELLRAAASEIDQYKRVAVQTMAPVAVAGHVAGDLVRLIAELLDNATRFSAPETQVHLADYRARNGGISIDILDQGIGMTDEQLVEANARLDAAGVIDGSTNRQLGLYVVGTLAGRHGVRVWLQGGEQIGGLRATVTIPAELLIPLAAPPPFQPAPLPPVPVQRAGEHNGAVVALHPAAQTTPAALPIAPAEELDEPDEPEQAKEQPAEQSAEDKPVEPEPEPQPAPPPVAAETAAPQPAPAAAVQAAPAQPAPAAPVQAAPAKPVPAQPVPEPAQQSEPAKPTGSEPTPIFDDLLSAWFQSTPSPTGSNWGSAADAGWKAAESVSRTPSESVTKAGLPRRKPGARMLPGSVTSPTPRRARHSGSTESDAERMRQRMSAFQSGLQRGRHAADPEPRHAAPTQPAPASDGAEWPTAKPETEPVEPGTTEAAETPEPARSDVQPESDGQAEQHTGAGLPRRRPGARIVPGSVPAGPSPVERGPAEQEANGVRGRLANFQRGLQAGRESVGAPQRPTADASAERESR